MNSEERQMLVAVLVADYATALDHINALAAMDVPVRIEVVARLTGEFERMVDLWRAYRPPLGDREAAVSDARAWATENLPLLERVLGREEGR